MYNPISLGKLADFAVYSIKGFDKTRFLRNVFDSGWEQLELKQRIRRISTALHSELSGNYKADLKQLLKYTKAIRDSDDRDNGFIYMFIPDYIEQYGTAHPAESLDAMPLVTVLCSCEFAIRPFIIKDQEAVLAKMLTWTQHPHPSVRRLASEGCRPRLPWGVALQSLKKDPAPILPILENLKDDSSEFVRKSVANNINDIVKDNPAIALKLAGRWKGYSRNADWIIKHGCRTLLKKADAAALGLFGLAHAPECRVENLDLRSSTLAIGDHLHFSFSLVNEGGVATPMRVEYAITYAKANGKQSRKVFKITENSYTPGKPVTFSRKQSFADMTTRKHYAGKHTIAIAINGCEKASVEFIVRE